MKIYTNLNYEIIGYSPSHIPSEYAHEYDVEDDTLNGRAFPVVCGYKYEPQYELDFNEDGSLKYDEQGNLCATKQTKMEKKYPPDMRSIRL